MTNDEFEQKVRQIMSEHPKMLEGDARTRVSLDAGLGGDVVGDPVSAADPLELMDALGDWAGVRPAIERQSKELR